MANEDPVRCRAEDYLKSVIAEVTESRPEEFDARAPFAELAIDSFRVLKIVKRLERDFGNLRKTLLFEYFNISDLAEYLVKEHSGVISVVARVGGGGHEVATRIENPAPPPVTVTASSARAAPLRRAEPIRMLERKAWADPDVGPIVRRLFDEYKNEAGASRGARDIAPYLFIGHGKRGYFNYARCKDVLLAYAYTGPREYFPELALELQEYCACRGLQLNIFTDQVIGSIGDVTWSSTPMGVLQRVAQIQEFSLQGGAMRRLRYQVSRFAKAGAARTEEYRCGSDPQVDRAIAAVIGLWCAGRTMVNPLVHAVKEEVLRGTLAPEHRLFLTYLDDTLQNVILVSPLSHTLNGYLMDLEFYGPEMPLGGLEFAIVRIIEKLASEGRSLLSLGGTYGCRIETCTNADPGVNEVLDELQKRGIFNDQGNLQFKNKFRPENQSIYLCRPVGCGHPDSIADIIMMIADPAGVQTPDEETRDRSDAVLPEAKTRDERIRNDSARVRIDMHADGAAAAAQPATDSAHAGKLTKSGFERRAAVLREAGFNPLNIAPEQVDFDLHTDSWAQLRTPAIEARMGYLHSQLQMPASMTDGLREIFPFQHVLLTQSGRAAEETFYSVFSRKGRVLQNLQFPTGLFHQIDNGFEPVELPCPHALQPDSPYDLKGELSLDAVRDQLTLAGSPVCLACVELGNNAVGGLPASRRHLAELKELLARHSVPLVIDVTRVLENTRRLIELEPQREGADLWSEVRQTLSYADAVIGSLTKDFCVNRGGLLATNDPALFQRALEYAEGKGHALDAIDRKLVALSLMDRPRIERAVLRRMESVRLMSEAWLERGIPIVRPAGGHCVLIDVKRLREFAGMAAPVASFLAWMYVNTGIVAGAHSVGMQKGTALNGLVRIAVPIGIKGEEVEEVIARVGKLFERREGVCDLVALDGSAAATMAPNARYRLREADRASLTAEAAAVAEEVVAEVESVDCDNSRAATASVAPAPDGSRAPATLRVRDIAIVGMACRFPGADSPKEFWKNLAGGVDSIREIPAERLARRRLYGDCQAYRGGFIESIDRFDSLFFNISPRDAALLDPQERLFLEVAWEAVEDAGYYPERLAAEGSSRKIGTFVGALWAMYQMLGVEERSRGNRTSPNSFLWSIANRVSYFMNLCGPSLTVDTACSSSLTALHLACESIYRGECCAAIVGGVNLDTHQSKLDINTVGGALSKDGVCRSFGKGADGYVAGEGVAAVYMKPLDEALAAGDHVYAVIKGIAINHGGRSSGYMVPNPHAQSDLIVSALKSSGVDARSIGYVEAHGTGTSLGDPIEASALSAAFGKDAVRQSCALGSVKSNIGHLEAAAGLAGVCKVILQMRHGAIAPSLHSAELNELIDFEHSPFYVVQKLERWEAKEIDGIRHPLRAGVSSFGAGGSNAHVILESVEAAAAIQTDAEGVAEHILPISARNPEQLRQAAVRLREYFSELPEDQQAPRPAMADIAYTLQVGRKPFECRAAVIGRTAAEIIEGLTHVIAGSAADRVFTGTIKNADSIGGLLSPAERAEFVGIVTRGRDPCKVAQLWVNGMFSDWQGWGDAAAARRVPLPTYPFADRRHWVGADGSDARSSARPPVVRHRFVKAEESTSERNLFRKTLDPQDFFIRDHRVSGIPTLPAVAYLELAREAAELASGRGVRRIRNVAWLSPIALRDGAAREVSIELKQDGDVVRFEIFTRAEGGARTLHSQGQVVYADEKEAPAEYIDIPGILAKSRKVTDGGETYRRFNSLGLQLGPTFQVLGDVFKSDGGLTLGALRLPAGHQEELQNLPLHPSLLDGCLQAGAAATIAENPADMGVPYSIGEVEILQPLQAECWSHVSVIRDQGRTGEPGVVRADVLVADARGRIMLKVKNLVGVPLTDIYRQGRPERQADGVERLYYGFDWLPAPLAAAATMAHSGAGVLLFDTHPEMHRLYREQVRREGGDPAGVILTTPCGRYEEREDGSYGIDPSEPSDYVKLLESLQRRNIPLDRICVAWASADEPRQWPDSAQRLSDALAKGVYALLFLCQALEKCMAGRSLRLLYLHQARNGEIQPQHEAIGAFAKTVQLEHPTLFCRTVAMRNESVSPAELLQVVVAEFQAEPASGVEVRYDRAARTVRTIRKLELGTASSPAHPSGIALREGGVYLITGGAGALGLAFAEFLARESKAKVALSGRSELDAARRDKLEELRRAGAEVLYVPADVASRSDVANLLAEVKRRFGRLDGIIHAAGVLRDAHLRNKTREQMAEVFAPKIFGTVHLDELTKDDPLDFFVTFSSLAAVGGNPGQCDYAFANQFMDSFALRRESLRSRGARAGKSLSFNWSLWEHGGMKLPAHVEATFRKVTGIRPLSTAAGLEAFTRGLACESGQIVVVEAVRDTLERLWGLAAPTRPRGEANGAGPADAGLQLFVEEELSRIATGMLKLLPEDLSTEKILLEMGFDSITLGEFATRISTAFRIDLTPVVFFEYPSIEKLAAHLATDRREQIAAVRTSQAVVPAATPSEPEPVIPVEASKPLPASSGGCNDMAIAIVGISGVMPQSDDLEEFWEHLRDAKDLITVIPEDRWRWQDSFGDPRTESGKSNSKWGGFMREVDKFDPLFFGISPREAQMMDPQQRIFLQTVWHAIEDSGHRVSDLSGTRTGVFVGVATNDYATLVNRMQIGVDAYTASGNSHSVLANRVSFLLNLRGPSAPIDTACSSSLIALHRAVESMLAGNCDMAIVGGVQVMLTPAAFISFSMAGMLSPEGRCKTFDKRADGYVRGEGAGAIVLKPLARAEADGDHIYAVVKATAENHGGRVTTLTAPNPAAQTEILLEAYTRAGIDPVTVGYMECHGTGTSLGDPIEIQALGKAFAELYRRQGKALPATPHCGLSSVKTNIGHLETAAGIAGVLKVLLAIRHKAIPASLHVTELNPYINLAGTPFYIVDKTTPWEAPLGVDGERLPRRAGVSSFGFGGANAHVVLEEYVAAEPVSDGVAAEPRLIVLSAKSEERLRDYAGSLRDHLQTHEVALDDLAYTLQVGRDEMTERLAFTASSVTEVTRKLDEFLSLGAGFQGGYRGSVRRKHAGAPAESPASPGSSTSSEEVGRAWVNGSAVEWTRLHGGSRRRRLPLPSYPFARERHWLPVAAAARKEAQAEHSHSLSHPMLHRDASTGAESRFTSRFTGAEFYLADHAVRGQPVMPAVAYLEWARAAGEALHQGSVTSIRDVVWLTPLAVNEGSKEVDIVLGGREGPIPFSVCTAGQSGKRIEHCRGLLRLAETGPKAERTDIPALRARCTHAVVAAPDLYEFLSTSELRLGPGLQGVREVRLGKGECLVDLNLPAHLAGDAPAYALHPAIVDGALHATLGMIKRIRPDIPWSVPSSVEAVELLGDARQVRYAHGRWPDRGEQNPICVSIDLLDEDGRVLVRIGDFRAKSLTTPLQPKVPNDRAESEPERINLFAPVWAPLRLPSGQSTALPPRVLLLGDDPAVLQWAHASYPDVMTLSVAASRTVTEIAADLRAARFDEILWVSPTPPSSAPSPTEQLLREQESGVIAVFRLAKSLIEAGFSAKPVQLTIVTRRACAVSPEDETDPTHAAVPGFTGSLAKEVPRWKIRCVDVDQLESVSLRELLSSQLHDRDKAYARRGPQWLQQRFEAVAETPELPPAYRQRGVYVVIGGAGGLGQVWSRFMIERYQARIVWIGRRQPTPDIADRLATLAAVGDAPWYVSADASDSRELSQARQQILDRYGTIHGVVHSTVVLRDQGIARMSEADFRAVLSAKLQTSANMIDVFGRDRLDFALFFSSVMSFSRSPGQANYAAGCTFVDGLAQHLRGRRPYAVKVANWGYWGEVGVAADPDSRRRMRKLGIGSIEPVEGMAALQELMGGSRDQLIIIKTVRDATAPGLGLGAGGIDEPAARPKAAARAEPDRSTDLEGPMNDYVRDVLLGHLSEELQLDRGRIESDAAFAELGVDSIIAVRLVGRISETLGIELEATGLFDHSTLERLVAYIVGKWGERIRGPGIAREATRRPADTNTVASSDSGDIRNGFATEAVDERPEPIAITAADERPEPIAIIGASGQFADCESLEELWPHLREGSNLVRDVSRWSPAECALVTDRSSSFCAKGTFLKAIDRFDASFFRIQDEEATCMDPQQRLFLEESWKALEDAGYVGQAAQETQCGVYVGCSGSNYDNLFAGEPPPQVFWGNSESVIPARIAYHLNLQGPAIAVNTACSSSLVTVHLACQALRAREIDMALAGGVFLQATAEFYQVANRAKMLSPTGACRSFDASADGFVPAEGVGAVVLKRFRDALRDGDHIHAVIVGSGTNQDGRSNGLTAPNGGAQERLERTVYKRFGIDPDQVQLLEAHGTGTVLGDSIEFEAASHVFREHSDRTQYCSLGSIKANIGHAATAAGIASLLKVVLCLRNREIPAAANFERTSRAVALESSPFYVNTKARTWDVGSDGKRRAAISSFSFNGTNAHLVIEGAPQIPPLPPDRPAYLIVLSARSPGQLRRQAENLLAHLGRAGELSMADLSHTLLVGRAHFSERLACIAQSRDDLARKLEEWLQRGAAGHIYCGPGTQPNNPERVSLKKFGNHCIDSCRGADGAEYLEHLTTVADLFAQGYALRFERLFTGRHRRIPLPTYPFARERYWPQADAQPEVAALTEQMSAAANSDSVHTGQASPIPTDPKAWVELLLRCAAAGELGKPAESIDTELNFLELGLTSIGVADFIYKVSRALGAEVAVNIVFAHPTIGALSEHLASACSAEVAALAGCARPDELLQSKTSAPAPEPAPAAQPREPVPHTTKLSEPIRVVHGDILRQITRTNGANGANGADPANYERVTL